MSREKISRSLQWAFFWVGFRDRILNFFFPHRKKKEIMVLSSRGRFTPRYSMHKDLRIEPKFSLALSRYWYINLSPSLVGLKHPNINIYKLDNKIFFVHLRLKSRSIGKSK